MADIKRTAEAVWKGELRGGSGEISSASGVLKETPYSFGTRFEQRLGTNPEELIAAAQAACFSMAFAATLGDKGYKPDSIETQATCTVSSQPAGGWKITKMRLVTRGRVPGMDGQTFERIAQEAEGNCPVANLLRGGLEIELEASLA
jgi:osmotically inducible protein OsmC